MFRDRVLTTAALVLLLAGCSESGGDPDVAVAGRLDPVGCLIGAG